jgi:hypothetical protein
MKRALPYIIGLILLILLAAVLVSGSKNRPKKLDERITLKKEDKIPYGMAVAKDLVIKSFPKANVSFHKKELSLWSQNYETETNQALFLIADFFNADEDELGRIFQFAESGNTVFIIARSLSYETLSKCGFSYYDYITDQWVQAVQDSLIVSLERPVFTDNRPYVYPGKRHESYFYELDTLRTIVLGRNQNGGADFIQMNKGRGKVFFHLAPLAFSNYFILHKDNHKYFEQVISVVPPGVEKILWDEYFLTKPGARSEEPSWLRVLWKQKEFKWGLFTALAALFFYVLLNMRRRQRMIPTITRPKNESLEFVKTLGRLYYQRRDHMNLARKMGAHFRDHVRARYNLPTVEMEENFIITLQKKSGYPEAELKQIVEFITFLETAPAISERQLVEFQKKLESFYEKT